MVGTAARHTGHHLTLVHWTTPISGKPSRLECECSWSFEALPDLALPDPHEIHNRAYLAHRAVVKAGPARVAGEGWTRMAIERDTEYSTALGRTKLSPQERGRMGAEVNRRKRAAAVK